jgi:hypothetical protein
MFYTSAKYPDGQLETRQIYLGSLLKAVLRAASIYFFSVLASINSIYSTKE